MAEGVTRTGQQGGALLSRDSPALVSLFVVVEYHLHHSQVPV
ncbi:MAG TPA: hypothetical protein VFG82_02285 [Rubrobacter sp.]|nr:hypothetical protein [Rubrobacter sp.]